MATKDTYITSSHDVTIDSNYANWLHALKDNYQKAQVKAAIKVNAEKLLWNWQLGRDLVLRKAEEQWGTGVVEQLSLDLQAAFPNEKGFSSRNLRSMKQWYEFYSSIWKQPVSKLLSVAEWSAEKLKQLGAEIHEQVNEGMPFPDIFAYVPWGHHTEILKKCHTVEEALSVRAPLSWPLRTFCQGWCVTTNCYDAQDENKPQPECASGCGLLLQRMPVCVLPGSLIRYRPVGWYGERVSAGICMRARCRAVRARRFSVKACAQAGVRV